jgi:hypothetical protein
MRALNPDINSEKVMQLKGQGHIFATPSKSFPPTYTLFSSNFAQPPPPLVPSEFQCHFKQHKWAPNMSHITSGMLYVSSRNAKARVDQAYNSALGSSLFDYANVSTDGLVWNAMWEVRPNVKAEPKIWTGYVLPAFPLWKNDTLVERGAVFMGVVEDGDMGLVATVSCA